MSWTLSSCSVLTSPPCSRCHLCSYFLLVWLSFFFRVSYIKAIDLWMSTCLVFVFAALIEFAVVNVLSRRRRAVTPPPAVHITSFENCPGPSSEATCAISNSSPRMDSEKGRPFKEVGQVWHRYSDLSCSDPKHALFTVIASVVCLQLHDSECVLDKIIF